MGNLIFSNKKKTAKEQLESIQSQIESIEFYKLSHHTSQKNFIALIYFLFFIIYPIGLGYIYFKFDLSDRLFVLLSSVFIIALPVLAYFIKKLVHFYFKWLNDNKNVQLAQLIKNKKNILAKVQETETFNDAKTILEKYDPSLLRNLSQSLNNLSAIDSPVRPRSISTSNQQQPFQQRPGLTPNPNRSAYPPNRNVNNLNQSRPTQFAPVNFPTPNQIPTGPINSFGSGRTIKPILPQNRSYVERFIDYMFNDGPNNRFALICRHCYAHNGMALPNEFEYISYICAYCGQFNPALKVRPNAPRIVAQQPKAIEAPKPPEPERKESTTSMDNLKIVEMSTELNKTIEPHVEEPSDTDNETKSRSGSIDTEQEAKDSEKKSEKIDDPIPFADDENVEDLSKSTVTQ